MQKLYKGGGGGGQTWGFKKEGGQLQVEDNVKI